ncbi:MAG: sigma-70 family RNA polymerase sigma factor [Acidobacteriales bacterium]|nr:sigma-70 family RNA polymerase sigma factor [Terriglobales bacterium]
MDAEHFEQVAMPLFSPLYDFAYWLTGNRDDAEDLVQEAYVRALRAFASFELGTNLHAWMFSILRNTFLTSRTGMATRNTVSLEDQARMDIENVESPDDTPDVVLAKLADRRCLEHALRRLSISFREVIVLCDIQEMAYRDIAETLGIPIGTVMSRLSRARKALRVALSQPGEGGG